MALAALAMDIGAATLKVTDAAGNVVPPAAPPLIAWHESFRYFRLSQTTEDLFDAYRNAYLALESVLSDIAPRPHNARGKPTESEGAWFKRALAEANQVVPLAPFAPPGSADPVRDLYEELHLETRCPMSHAKSGEKVLLPQNEAERQSVTASLRRLVGLYIRLAESHLAARRRGGMMMAGGFRLMFGRILDGVTVQVSDDESPFDGSNARPNPAGEKLVPLAPAGGFDASMPRVATRLWAAPIGELADLPFVRRVVATEGAQVKLVQVLDGRLDLGTAGRLEVLVGIRGLNVRQPRERYSF